MIPAVNNPAIRIICYPSTSGFPFDFQAAYTQTRLVRYDIDNVNNNSII